MCKFQKPSLPQGATEDERRNIMFNALYSLELNVSLLKEEHPEIDYSLYEKTSNVAGSLLIAV